MAFWYPVMLNMEGKRCFVFGGGAVAERKIGGLLEAGAQVHVISPALSGGLLQLAERGQLVWQQRRAEPEADVAAADFVFAATGDVQTDSLIAAAARSAGVPVNLANDGEIGDFLLPAVVRRGQLVLTASTSGASPAFASRVAREMADRYGLAYAGYMDRLRQIRQVVKSQIADAAERRRLLTAASEEAFLQDWVREAETVEPQRLIAELQRRAGSVPDGED